MLKDMSSLEIRSFPRAGHHAAVISVNTALEFGHDRLAERGGVTITTGCVTAKHRMRLLVPQRRMQVLLHRQMEQTVEIAHRLAGVRGRYAWLSLYPTHISRFVPVG